MRSAVAFGNLINSNKLNLYHDPNASLLDQCGKEIQIDTFIKRHWQKKQTMVQHIALAALASSTLFWLQVEMLAWQKWALIVLCWIFVLTTAVYLNGRYARQLVKLFAIEHDEAARDIQRTFKTQLIPYRKETAQRSIRFELPLQNLTLIVESFPLNLPLDDHINTTMATKMTIDGLNAENGRFAQELSHHIDNTFVPHPNTLTTTSVPVP